MRRTARIISMVCGLAFVFGKLSAESEPLEIFQFSDHPYAAVGRLFAASSENGSKQSGSATAVGPGVVLTAAHVYWTEAWIDSDDDNVLDTLPEGASPWLAYRQWFPQTGSSSDQGYDNVVSVVSLAGYDDALHEYDENRNDSTSPFEAFNRDSLLLIFSDDDATPHGFMPIHPRAVESGFQGQRNFYEVIGYPSAKYSGSDPRKWMMHRTTESDSIVLSSIPSSVYDGGYSFANSIYFGGDPLDSYAGNSGGPVVARTRESEKWVLVGVYVGSNALIRSMDEELAEMVNTAIRAQFEETDIRFRFTNSSISVGEGDGQVTIAVERAGDSTAAATASITTIGFQAQHSEDYGTLGNFSWDEGESGVKETSVLIHEDELREGLETFLLELDLPVGNVDGPGGLLVNIEDNDLNEPLDQWTTIDEVGAVDYSEVAFGKGRFVSVGATNAIYWSPDYQDVGVVDFPNLNRLFQLIYARGLFIGCGDGPQIIVSEDGKDWDVVELPTSISLFSIQYGNGRFVGVGGIDASSSSQGEIWVSDDARNWTKVYDEMHDRFDDVEYGNGLFLALAGADFYRSYDGLSWEKLETVGLGGTPGDMEFGSGRFVNAGRLGGIHYSVDGVEWTRARQEDEEAWYGVGYRNGYFLTTGISGKLATSTDGGITWIDRYPNTPESLWHGITAAGKMVVIGDNGHLMEALLPEFFDFIFQPIDQRIDEGKSVSFFADFLSSKAGPYTLQWQKNERDLPGETGSTLSIENVLPADVGNYQLIVTGDGTEYASAIAVLDIVLNINPPENSTTSTSTSRGVMLFWEDASSGETAYKIERRILGSETWETLVSLEANTTSYHDRMLTPDTEYEYRVSTISEGNPGLPVTSTVKTLSATNFTNLSSRGLVGQDDEVMIGGFTIPQGAEMTIYIRGLGPSLQSSGISNTISDPHLRLVPMSGSNSFELINTNWMDAVNVDAILAAGLPPVDDRESAILATLPPGAYTVILSSEVDEPAAVGMIEVYDITEGCSDCRLINLSTRAMVSIGNELMIGGLVISGVAEKQVYVRALGPSLTGITSTLQDPFLKMVSGGGGEASIDNWLDSANAVAITSLGLPPTDDREVAELYQLQQGTYTFQVSGVDNTSGVALLELYEVD